MKRTLILIGSILFVTLMFAGHAAAQDCVMPPAGLVSWWPGDGNADDIQSGNHGSFVNAATFAPGFVSSGNGEASSLNGGYVEISDSLSLRANKFTLDARIFPTSYTYGYVIGKGNHEYWLQLTGPEALKTVREGIRTDVGPWAHHTGSTINSDSILEKGGTT